VPKLTVERIRTLQYPERSDRGRFVLWDSELPGFGVRVYPTGRKAYVLSYRFRGRKRLMAIGPTTVLTLPEARERARKKLVEALDGRDPLTAREQDRAAPTMGELAARYVEHSKQHKRSWREDERRIRAHLGVWRTHQVAAVTRHDVETLHARIGATAPYEANRALALISRLFSLARQWGIVPANWVSPTSGVQRFPEDKRERWLKPEEVTSLAAALEAEPSVYVRGVLWLYLLTGARRSELLSAKWEHIETDANGKRSLVLPKTKSGRAHRIPLSAPALELLEGLPRLEGNPYIFPGKRAGAPLVNIAKNWERVRKAAKLEDVRLHDLRRTVGSWLAQSGRSLHLVGRILNHSDPSVTQIYARLGDETMREALEAHAKQVMGAAGKGKRADIQPLAQQQGRHRRPATE
jgi:integrase